MHTVNMIERHIKGGQKTFEHRHRNKSCSACLKSQGIKLDNLKPYTPIPSLKTLFSLFQCRILKHKEGTYESKLLVGNQLYDWYTHRQGWYSCFWCGKKALPFSLINRGEWPIILFSKFHGGGRLKISHIIILKHSHRPNPPSTLWGGNGGNSMWF